MAHCQRCNKFLLIQSSSGYCKNCDYLIAQEKEVQRKKSEEERKRQSEAEEQYRKAEEERKRRIEEERKEKEEEARKCKEMEEIRKRRDKEEEAKKRNEMAAKLFLEAQEDVSKGKNKDALVRLSTIKNYYSDCISVERVDKLIQTATENQVIKERLIKEGEEKRLIKEQEEYQQRVEKLKQQSKQLTGETTKRKAKSDSFYTKVVGVTFKNDDGSDRQRIIRNLIRNGDLEEGTELVFVPQPTNPYDSNCVLVNTRNGETLGTLSRDIAADVAPQIRQGYIYKAYVASQTGGDIGYAYGINIRVERYKNSGPKPNYYSGTTASTNLMYPHVIALKSMFADFFPEFRNYVVRDDDSWRMVNTGNLFWADEALQLKRQGKYVESCQLYFANILSRGSITFGWAQGIFKTLACAGDFADALAFGREWVNYADTSLPEPDSLFMHFSTLITMIQHPEYDAVVFPGYLQSISGNPNYAIDLNRTDLYSDEVLQKIRNNA